MIAVSHRFNAPQRQKFGTGHSGPAPRNEAELEMMSRPTPETLLETDLRRQLSETKDELKTANRFGLATAIGCVLLLIGGSIGVKTIRGNHAEKIGQAAALLSDATGGKINAQNLDKVIEAKQADSLATVAATEAQVVAQKAAQKALELRRLLGK